MVSVARDREITPGHPAGARRRQVGAPPPTAILHAIPRNIVDEQGGIDEPLGMLGTRLEVMVHLVTGNVTRSRTLLTCVNRAGIEVVEMVFEPLATAEVVLTPYERELGVLLADVGAGTTEYALFSDGEIQYSAVAPIGAGHFTNDLAMVLRTPFAEAERIKTKHVCYLPSMITDEEGVAVPTVAGGNSRIVPKRELCEILQPRAEELFNMIHGDLRKRLGRGLRGGVKCRPAAAPSSTAARAGGAGVRRRGALRAAARPGQPGRRDRRPLVDGLGLLLYARAARRHSRSPEEAGFSVRGVMGSLRGMFSDLL
jgi:cell division ATPase FtsA